MNCSLSFVALFVPDLQVAEAYYQSVFNMELIGREAELVDGLWYTLPFDKSWDEAEAAGVKLDMLALRKDEFDLALFRGNVPAGQVYVIGLNMPMEEIGRRRSQMGDPPTRRHADGCRITPSWHTPCKTYEN